MSAEQRPSLAAEMQCVRDFYAALNAGDVPAVLPLLDPQMEHIEFEGTPSAGAHRGLAEVQAHITKARATWAEGSCEPQRLIAAGGRVVVLVHVRVRLKDSGKWAEGDVGDVFTFKDGKICEMRTFAEQKEALAWAGA